MDKAETNNSNSLSFAQGLRDGLPICVGYFSVSFSFGILCVNLGLSPFIAGIISLTNVTSAGQFAGVRVMLAEATFMELILTQLIINSRYALMSLSLSQKITPGMPVWQRLLVAFANTDEIFAVAMHNKGYVPFLYMMGLELTPIFGWTAGTLAGAVASGLLPENIRSALGIALYGMFIAIVIPAAKEEKGAFWVVVFAIAASLSLTCVPYLNRISPGFQIIIATLVAAVAGAVLFPVENTEGEA